jgi:hypothetical protein
MTVGALRWKPPDDAQAPRWEPVEFSAAVQQSFSTVIAAFVPMLHRLRRFFVSVSRREGDRRSSAIQCKRLRQSCVSSSSSLHARTQNALTCTGLLLPFVLAICQRAATWCWHAL